MKIAIIGSRGLQVNNMGDFVSSASEIVSGGAVGIDTCTEEFARKNGIHLTVFLPEYNRYGKAAPIVRNKRSVDYADRIIAFWDGKSKGTLSTIKYAQKIGKKCEIILCEEQKITKNATIF